MKPTGSSPTIVNFGNATGPITNAMPMIDNRIGLRGATMRAPGLTGNAPRLPIFEKITSPNINATKGIATAQSRVIAVATRGAKRTVNTVSGYVRALATRQRTTPKFTSEISTAIWSK